jgi:hypothetical protein
MEDNKGKAQETLTNQQKLDSLKDTAEYAALLNNHGKLYLESQEGELGRKYTGKALNMLDNLYMEAMGLKEKPEGKTTDIIINTAKENLELKKQLEKLSQKETKDVDNNNEDLKILHNNQVLAMQKQIDELNKKNESLLVVSQDKETSNSIALGLQNATFDPKYSDRDLEDLISIRKNRLLSNRKRIDNKDVFYKETGEVYEHANGLPMSAKEVANVVFSDLFLTKKAGGNANDTNNKASIIKGDVLTMENVSNLNSYSEFNREFNKLVQAKGWAAHEERTIKLKRATIEHYKLGSLPLG